MRTQPTRLLILAISLTAALSASLASAQNTSDTVRLEAHGTLSAYEGIGAGIRGEFVVLPSGALPNVNDDISFTAGGDAILFFDDDGHDHGRFDSHDHDGGLGIWAAAAVQWNFYLSQQWSVFPELGMWLQFGRDGRHDHDDAFDMDLLVGLGVRYHLGGRSAILFRIEHPGLLHIGMQF